MVMKNDNICVTVYDKNYSLFYKGEEILNCQLPDWAIKIINDTNDVTLSGKSYYITKDMIKFDEK